MSGNNGVPPASVQETGRQFDLGSATTFAIDQAVADGEVDGRNNRAPFRMLSRIAFRGVRMPGSVIHDFRDALTVDERYVDRVRDRYGYEPVLSEGSEARATPSAIVNGRGIYSEEEHQVVMDLMETYTRVIYDSLNPQDHIVHLREVSGALNGAGISPTYDEFGGFMTHMRLDPRFKRLNDGRIILMDRINEESFELPPEIPKVDDFGPLIDNALPYVITGHSGTFRPGALLGTLKALGTPTRGDQVNELFEKLRMHPDVMALESGDFKIVGDVESVPHGLQAPSDGSPVSLEVMMREAFNGNRSRRKPRKRRGGWRRTKDMTEQPYDE